MIASNPRTHTRRPGRLRVCARLVLVPVAVIGAVLSFRSLYEAATPSFGPSLAAGFPLLVDLLILGASLQYVDGARIGRPMNGWRLTAHAGAIGTVLLNAWAAERLGDVPWHVTAPLVWAVLVELTAAQVLSEWKSDHASPVARIPVSLWLTAPIESGRTRMLMLRTGIEDAQAARVAVGAHAAAREALRLALPDRQGRHVRKIINRQLRSGNLSAAGILGPLGWDEVVADPRDGRPETVLKAILQGVLSPSDGDFLDRPGPVEGGADNACEAEASVDDVRDVETPEPQMDKSSAKEQDSQQEAASSGAGSSVARTDDHQRRLADAIAIVEAAPNVTGPQLRGELAGRGWVVSDRTATRILAAARRTGLSRGQESCLAVVEN